MRDVFDVFDPNKAGEYFIDMHRAEIKLYAAEYKAQTALDDLWETEEEVIYQESEVARRDESIDELLELLDEYWTIKGALWNLWDTLVEHFLMWRAK